MKNLVVFLRIMAVPMKLPYEFSQKFVIDVVQAAFRRPIEVFEIAMVQCRLLQTVVVQLLRTKSVCRRVLFSVPGNTAES